MATKFAIWCCDFAESWRDAVQHEARCALARNACPDSESCLTDSEGQREESVSLDEWLFFRGWSGSGHYIPLPYFGPESGLFLVSSLPLRTELWTGHLVDARISVYLQWLIRTNPMISTLIPEHSLLSCPKMTCCVLDGGRSRCRRQASARWIVFHLRQASSYCSIKRIHHQEALDQGRDTTESK